MGTHHTLDSPALVHPEEENETWNALDSNHEPGEVGSQSLERRALDLNNLAQPEGNCVPELNLNNEIVHSDSDMEIEDLNNLPDYGTYGRRSEKDLVGNPPILQAGILLSETIKVKEVFNGFSSRAENGGIADEERSRVSSQRDVSSISGVKRKQIASDEHQPSVHVVYSSLRRASKQKLEELLKQWSEWHAQDSSLSLDEEELESGEKTFFPALHVGTEKMPAVSFWIDNQTRQLQEEFIPLDCSSVPLYDRGFTLGLNSADGLSNVEGGLEIVDDASRCFNCGSYNHALKECPKPFDNAAVSNARKQHRSKRNSNVGPHNSTRYYQSSKGGKYDDLRPGSLDAETRKLLGLGELDPPPWLNRMRELGYPPGYLDPEDEDEPSGIIIYADDDEEEEIREEEEDGEIVETDDRPKKRVKLVETDDRPHRTGKIVETDRRSHRTGKIIETVDCKPRKKQTVAFPGLNAPIPKNADERIWIVGSSSSSSDRSRSHRRSNHYSEPSGRGYHNDQWKSSADIRDDGPPGVDPGYISSIYGHSPRHRSHNSSRFGEYDDSNNNQRSRRSSLGHEDDLYNHRSSLYSPPWRR